MVRFVTLFGITLRNSILMITHYERSCRSRGHAVTYECLSGRSFAPVRSAAAAAVNQTCIRNSSGSLVMPAAIRRAASRVNSLARDRRCSYCRRAFSRRSPMCSGHSFATQRLPSTREGSATDLRARSDCATLGVLWACTIAPAAWRPFWFSKIHGDKN